MVIVAVIYALMNMSKGNAFKEKVSWQQTISGFFFAFAALTYLISAQPNMNGLATGFVLSQTSVVLAIANRHFFLNQKNIKRINDYNCGISSYFSCSINHSVY